MILQFAPSLTQFIDPLLAVMDLVVPLPSNVWLDVVAIVKVLFPVHLTVYSFPVIPMAVGKVTVNAMEEVSQRISSSVTKAEYVFDTLVTVMAG